MCAAAQPSHQKIALTPPPPPPTPPPTHTDNEYDATVKLPSTEFQRIVKDLSTIGDTGERC